jgi:hypothetical protein
MFRIVTARRLKSFRLQAKHGLKRATALGRIGHHDRANDLK